MRRGNLHTSPLWKSTLWKYVLTGFSVLLVWSPASCLANEETNEQSNTSHQGNGAHHKEGRGKMRDSLEEIKTLVTSLQQQVTSLKKAQARDKSHIRSLENRLSVTMEDYQSLQGDIAVTMETVSQSNDNVESLEESQKKNFQLISSLQNDNDIFQQELADVKKFHVIVNETVLNLRSDIANLDDKVRLSDDTMTSVVEEMSAISAQQIKQKSNLKHMKLELAGFIQELLPDDDDDDVNNGHHHENRRNHDELQLKNHHSLSDQESKESSKNSPTNEAADSSENSSQLPSDTLPPEGSGNVEKVTSSDNMKNTRVTQKPLSQNTKQNDKKIKREMKIMKESLGEKDMEIERLKSNLLNLSLDVSKLENQVVLLQKDGEISRTQNMAANLTQYLITLDQWRVASPSIINTTQENQEQLDVFGDLIMSNKKQLGMLETKLVEQKYVASHFEQSLEVEMQKLNDTIKKVKHRIHHHDHAMSEELAEQFDDMRGRLYDLDNRIMTLEVKVLNSSLNTCAKQQSDFYQDVKLKDMTKKVDKIQDTLLVQRETLTRMDRGLYRLHLDIKSHKDTIDSLKKEARKANSYLPDFKSLQDEVKKFLHHLPRDCSDVYQLGHRDSGEYIIHPAKSPKSVRVYCEMQDDGGWTVFQRRVDGSEPFNRPWDEYREGFGKINGEFWLGNEFIHLLTKQRNCSLLVEMFDTFGQKWVAKYDTFKMGDEADKYSLFLDGYHGNATDSLGDANGMAFSTEDRDLDASSTHCALYYTAGWWYKHCHYCNLNGRYNVGIVWFNQKVNEWLQMNRTTLKLISH